MAQYTTNPSKHSNYKFIAIFAGSIIGLAGILLGVIVVMQPQLLNPKAARQDSAPRSIDCTFAQNANGRLEVRNPATGRRMVKNLEGQDACYVGDIRNLGDIIQECVPLEGNGCGNIGIYKDQENTYIKFSPGLQHIVCKQDSDCVEVGTTTFTVCDRQLGRCKEDLAGMYCSRITSPARCNSTFFYDLNDNKKACSWTEDAPSGTSGCYTD